MLLVLAASTYEAGRTAEWLSNIAAAGCALFAVITGLYFMSTWLPYDSNGCAFSYTGFSSMLRCSTYEAAGRIIEERWDYFSGSIAAGIFAVIFSWLGTKHAEKYDAGETPDV